MFLEHYASMSEEGRLSRELRWPSSPLAPLSVSSAQSIRKMQSDSQVGVCFAHVSICNAVVKSSGVSGASYYSGGREDSLVITAELEALRRGIHKQPHYLFKE
jgi:hypothetical protein